jgi:putative ABC transport system permease protein
MRLQFSLAWRYLNGRRLRTVLTTLAVVFGVLVIFAMNTILPTMTKALGANMLAAHGAVDFTATRITSGSFSADILPAVARMEGIRAVSASLNRTVNLPADFYDKDPKKPDRISALSLTGIDPEAERALLPFPVVSGRFLEPSDGASAVISQTLADTLDLKVGEVLPIPSVNGVTDLKVVGILPPRLKPGAEEVLVTLKQAGLMTGEDGRVNRIEIDIVNPFTSEAQRARIQKAVQDVLGDEFRVGTLISGTEAFDENIKTAQAAFNLFGVLALFMGGFIIFNTFRTVVAERRRDIGMLRAIGANRRTIIGMIIAEGTLQGLLGSAVGLALGYALVVGGVKLASPYLSRYINLKISAPVVSPLLVVGCVLLGVGITVLAALLPARNAGRVTPLEAMRPMAAQSGLMRRISPGFVAGALVIALSTIALFSGKPAVIVPGGLLFLVGLVLVAPTLVTPLAGMFGRLIAAIYARQGIGEIACGNIKRQSMRTAVTASSTMLGLAVIVAAGGLLSSLTVPLNELMQKNMGSDYLFVPPAISVWSSDIGAGPEFARRLRGINGVSEVATMRYAGSSVKGQAVSLLGVDPVAFPKVGGLYFLQGNDSAYDEISKGRALIANGVFLKATGAKVGQTVRLLGPGGSVEYRVAALAADLLNAKAPSAFISQANLFSDFGKEEDVFLQLNLKPGADAEAAERGIKAVSHDYPQFQMIRGRTFYNTIKDQMNAALSGIYLLFAFLALPSLIAMINTLTISVIERTREIGMIRAVGATRGQIRGMVLAEALLLAAIGTAFGLLGGLYLGDAFVSAIKDIFPLGFAFPIAGMLTAVFFGLFFGALAAIVPARQAARLQIVEALRYE